MMELLAQLYYVKDLAPKLGLPLFVIFALITLYRLHKRKVSLDDLILDKYTNRVSLSKFSQLTALCVSSWGFIILTIDNRLSEWYFAGYMMTWAGAHAAMAWIKTKGAAPLSVGEK